ncbi:MAG: hypothetical protein ABH896_03725, partial [Candidatus Jacksonbacteria bacterium]
DEKYTDMYYCQDNEPSMYQYQSDGSVFTLYARLEYNKEAWCNKRTEADCRTWTGEAGFCVWKGTDCIPKNTVDHQPTCRGSDGLQPFNIIFDIN